MIWQNIQELANSSLVRQQRIGRANSQFQSNLQPAERWGHSSVAANNKMYILAGYQGNNTHQRSAAAQQLQQSRQSYAANNNLSAAAPQRPQLLHAANLAIQLSLLSHTNTLGQYLGDVFSFDFNTLQYTKHNLTGVDAHQLARSNQTAVYYEPHNAIYVFGGGQAQKMRFNDTLKLQLNSGSDNIQVEVQQVTGSIPAPRTYHASCIVGKYMIVCGGEAAAQTAASDLADIYALNFETLVWYKLQNLNNECYHAKRFHTASTISENRVVSFGGCHSEYVHLNDVNTFDLSNFVNSDGADTRISCLKQTFPKNSTQPSTRWGHAAAVYQDKVYILGGRNEIDLNDLFVYDPKERSWSEVEIAQRIPKPRRRHSAVFICSSLVMFGGFDSEFYNDMYAMHLNAAAKSAVQVQLSTIHTDYAKILRDEENSNLTLVLPNGTEILANKSLILYSLFEREINYLSTRTDNLVLKSMTLMGKNIHELLQCSESAKSLPKFLSQIYKAAAGEKVFIQISQDKQTVIRLLEYFYTGKLMSPITGVQAQQVSIVCNELGLKATFEVFDRMCICIKSKLEEELIKDIRSNQSPIVRNSHFHLSAEQLKTVAEGVKQLAKQLKFEFETPDSLVIQSPEDKITKDGIRLVCEMLRYRNLDFFHDLVFKFDSGEILPANSAVVTSRCDYFRSMLTKKYGFKFESDGLVRFIEIKGIERSYFQVILQYLYSDTYQICSEEMNSLTFFLSLLIYADYFMIQRLVDICSKKITECIRPKNAIALLLIAQAHNATQLESQCMQFIVVNETQVMKGSAWNKLCQLIPNLAEQVKQLIKNELEADFVDLSVKRFILKNSKSQYPAFRITPAINRNSKFKERALRDFEEAVQSREQSSDCSSKGEVDLVRAATEVQSQLMVKIDMTSIMSGQSYILLQEHFPLTSYGLQSPSQKLKKSKFSECDKENDHVTLNAAKAAEIKDFGQLLRKVGRNVQNNL